MVAAGTLAEKAARLVQALAAVLADGAAATVVQLHLTVVPEWPVFSQLQVYPPKQYRYKLGSAGWESPKSCWFTKSWVLLFQTDF